MGVIIILNPLHEHLFNEYQLDGVVDVIRHLIVRVTIVIMSIELGVTLRPMFALIYLPS